MSRETQKNFIVSIDFEYKWKMNLIYKIIKQNILTKIKKVNQVHLRGRSTKLIGGKIMINFLQKINNSWEEVDWEVWSQLFCGKEWNGP